MNIKNAFYLFGGVLVGFGTAWVALEDQVGKKYADMANANRRAYERAAGLGKITKVESNAEGVTADIELNTEGMRLHSISLDAQPNAFGEGIVITPLSAETAKNDYHRAIEATETPVEIFVAGGVNDYGISYLEEEEYEEEDGRPKLKIDIMMDESNPVFIMDGQQIDDWDRRVGDSILVDMYKMCPPGVPAILYVRNHQNDEDYEVVRVDVL